MKNIYIPFTFIMACFTLSTVMANDCSTANSLNSVVLASSGAQVGDLTSSGYSGATQCAGPGDNPDLWYSFTAEASTTFIQVAPNGDLNPVIEVFDACGGNQLICRNSTGPGANETARLVNLVPGETYYFSVYHAGVVAPTSNSFNVVVAHIPYVELRSQDCDQFNYNTNQIIRSTSPVANSFTLTGYQWLFEELEAPFNTYEIVSLNGTNPNYRLQWFDPVQYGRTYNVSVRILVAEGNSAGDYGNVCTIGFQPNVLSTQLEQQYANQFFNFCDVVGANPVGAATQYRWAFNDLTTITSVFGDDNSRLLRLQKVPGLLLGQVYIVSAFATVGGVESPQGLQRFITMNNFVPNTGLRQDLYPCGQTYPINTQVQAVEVCSAQSYTWRFNNTSQSQPTIFYTRSDGSRFIRLDWLTELITGDSYNVDVRATQGNLLGDYSTICNITIGPSTAGVAPFTVQADEEMMTTLDASFEGPEPLGVNLSGNDGDASGLFVHISHEHTGQVQLELYDMSGKLVAHRMETVAGNADVAWRPSGLPKGLYLLRVNNGVEVVTKKVVL